jgi:hypothetical protein
VLSEEAQIGKRVRVRDDGILQLIWYYELEEVDANEAGGA